MGFLGRIIRPLVENAFNRMQTEAEQEALQIQGEKLAKIQSFFPIQKIFSPMANNWKEAGRQQVRQDIDFFLGKAFEPFLADLDTFSGTMENMFGAFLYENRAITAVGEVVGGGIGFIAGFFLPGGPLVWQGIFSWLGGTVAPFIAGDITHPDIPGSPGEIPVSTPNGGLPIHAQELYNDLFDTLPITPVYAPNRTQVTVWTEFRMRHFVK